MPEVNISQSIIKSLFAYKNKEECGLQFQEKFIKGNFNLFPASDAMKLGIYFEYLATGSFPKSGETPEPERLKSGELAAPYKRILTQVENFKKILSHYGITILDVGKKIIVNGCEGTVDIIAEWDGKIVFIDTKYSGLLHDKWSAYGWDADMLPEKQNLILQPIHYKYLSILEYGYEVDFYFFVFSSTNENDYKIIKIELDDTRIDEHKTLVRNTRTHLNHHIKVGFKPIPELMRCLNCPIKQSCSSRMEIPKIETVYI